MSLVSMLSGGRRQASLSIATETIPSSIAQALRGSGAQYATVTNIDYERCMVEVYNSNGSSWVPVLHKTSKKSAGRVEMPNMGDQGVVLCVNGDEKAGVWLGGVDFVQRDTNLVKDENYTTRDALVHRDYYKHETGTFWLLDKLGKFMATFMKKASAETETSKKNLEFSVGNDGTISIKKYKADGTATAMTVDVSLNGSVTLENDGHLVTLTAESGSEAFQYRHKIKNSTIQVAANGNVTLNAGQGTVSVNQATGQISVAKTGGGTITIMDTIQATSPGGVNLLISDALARVATASGAGVTVTSAGLVTITGTTAINIVGAIVNLTGAVVNVGAVLPRDFLVMKGFFDSYYNTHTHPTPSGTSGPPTSTVPPAPPPGIVTTQLMGG